MVWFEGRSMVGEIPPEAIYDCTRPGPVDEAVARWVATLEFEADPMLTREYLSSFGAWSDEELDDSAQNIQRLFWIICGSLKEDVTAPIYLED